MPADDIARALQQAAKRITTGLSTGLGSLTDEILDEAKRLCPSEGGDLEESGTTRVDGLNAGIGFGKGPSADYAVDQHEDLSQSHDSGKQGKYLEVPFQQIGQTKGLQTIAKGVRL